MVQQDAGLQVTNYKLGRRPHWSCISLFFEGCTVYDKHVTNLKDDTGHAGCSLCLVICYDEVFSILTGACVWGCLEELLTISYFMIHLVTSVVSLFTYVFNLLELRTSFFMPSIKETILFAVCGIICAILEILTPEIRIGHEPCLR
jgi:hypothetical protein